MEDSTSVTIIEEEVNMPEDQSNSKPKRSERIVIDDDGKEYVLKGAGWALEYGPLDLDPRLDLTKPIWEQVQRLDRLDRRAAQKPKAAA